jgi:hypothetical protein
MRERLAKRDPLGSVEEFQLETRVMRSPGLEVEVELTPPLPLVASVGGDDLDRVIVDLVGNEAPAVEEVPQVGAESWIGESNAHGGRVGPCIMTIRVPGSQPTAASMPSRSSAAFSNLMNLWVPKIRFRLQTG